MTAQPALTESRFRRAAPFATAGVLYALIIAGFFHGWLAPFHLPQRGDPSLSFRAGDLTPLFNVWNQVTLRSLIDNHELPLWSDHVYCGEPFFAKPQIAVFSLTTLAGLGLGCVGIDGVASAQAISGVMFLVHLWIAGMSMFLLGREYFRELELDSTTTIPPIAPMVMGVVFMWSNLMVEHTMIGHGPIVMVACWIPLIVVLLRRGFRGDRPMINSLNAAVLVAVQLLAGGSTIFLYTALIGAGLGCGWILFGRDSDGEQPSQFVTRFKRVVVSGVLVGGVGFCLSAVKLFPGLELMPVSCRAGGLSLEVARGRIIEFQEPHFLGMLTGDNPQFGIAGWFVVTILLAGVGLVCGLLVRRVRWFVFASIALVILGGLIPYSDETFEALWNWLPVFKYQRIPQRALVMSYFGIAILAGIGCDQLLRKIGHNKMASWGLGSILLALVFGEHLVSLPELPPMQDTRTEVESNAIVNYMASQPGEFRVHAVESRDRNWGIEHVTNPIGLSNFTGWEHLWLLEYLGAEGIEGETVMPYVDASYIMGQPARYWGMMNVRYVTSTEPIEVPGLEFVEKFPVSELSQPRKSAGPFLYQNEFAMGRHWVVPSAIAVVGEPPDRLAASYAIMSHSEFDPSTVVLLQISPEKVNQVDMLPNVVAAVVPGDFPTPNLRVPKVFHYQSGVNSELGRTVAAIVERGQFEKFLGGLESFATMPLTETLDESSSTLSIGLQLSEESREGYLVMAEKFAHFPGWECESSGYSRWIWRANAVATAVPLLADSKLAFSYRPVGFVAGALVSTIAWLGVFCFWGTCWLRRQP